MLVRITDQCNFKCKHCMIKTDRNGKYITTTVYKKIIEFNQRYDIPIILLSGGEPTLHPNLMKLIYITKKAGISTSLLTNGSFLEKEDLKDKLLQADIDVQITNDPRYYPREIPIIKHPKLLYENKIRIIAPFYRALENKIPITQKAPSCFNLRYISRHHTTLKQTLLHLRSINKFCIPSIDPDGTLRAGESNLCAAIGTVYDYSSQILYNIQNSQCSKCGLIYKLPPIYKQAIM